MEAWDYDWSRYHAVAIDTETTGLHFMRDSLIGFSVSNADRGHYYDIREDKQPLRWLATFMAQFGGRLVFHNINFDYKFLARADVRVPLSKVDDTVIMASVVDEHRGQKRFGQKPKGYSLESLCKDYAPHALKKGQEFYDAMAKIFGGLATANVQMPRIKDAPYELVAEYAIGDTDATLALWQALLKEVDRQDLWRVLQFEYDTIPYVLDQEMHGIRIDEAAATSASVQIALNIDKAKRELNEIVGKEFNVNSTPQIREYYSPQETTEGFFVGGIPCPRTPKGNPSINNDVLQALSQSGDPAAAKIIEIRSLIRTKDTFLEGHILGESVHGRVYPTINQISKEEGGTSTGRFSYVGPALQQIPNRNKEIAAIVKPCFLPDEGQVWLDGDLNSFEVRVFAHLVSAYNAAIADIYREDPLTDFHRYVAELMEVPRNPRPEGGANAKQLNLSMIFNSGIGAIAQQLGYETEPDSFTDERGLEIHFHRPKDRAVYKILDQYHNRVQGVKKLADIAETRARKHGFLFTMYGRHLRFPGAYRAYKASGILIQATAADINKRNWAVIGDCLGDRGRLLLNTHDSYSMSVEEGRESEAWADVKNAVETAHDLRVPIILDKNGVGTNWWEALQGDG